MARLKRMKRVIRKPLMLMRKKGLYSTFYGAFSGMKIKAKSVGEAVEKGLIP